MNRSDIRTIVKNITGRNFTGIDTVLNNLIDTAVELFGSTISSVYEEEEWSHTITQAEVDSKTDNWLLPSSTKQILKATVINPKGTEKVYFPLEIVSPMDWYDIGKLDAYQVRQLSYDYTVQTPRLGDGLRVRYSGRVDYATIPRFCTRINENLFVFPRPSKNEVDWIIKVLLAVRPSALTSDTSTNIITDKFPYALIWYVGALFWLHHLNDVQRGQTFMQTASLLMTSFATQQEISKLSSITFKVARE
jgi:hypothetical protein